MESRRGFAVNRRIAGGCANAIHAIWFAEAHAACRYFPRRVISPFAANRLIPF
jgi:hypothetical protein